MVGWYRQGHRPEQEDQRVLHYWRSQVFWGCADHPNAEKANICFSRDIKRGGQLASPSISLMPWWAILVATWQRMGKDHLTVLAAGAAFQALFSLFPMLTAAVSLYGLVADPSTVERQITAMQGVLPPEAVKLIATWLPDAGPRHDHKVRDRPHRQCSARPLEHVVGDGDADDRRQHLLRRGGEAGPRLIQPPRLGAGRRPRALWRRGARARGGTARRPRPTPGVRRLGGRAGARALADPGRNRHPCARHRIPLRTGSGGAEMAMDQLGIGFGNSAMDLGLDCLHDLRLEGRQLRQDLRLARRRHHPAALVLSDRLRHPRRGGTERGDRAPNRAGETRSGAGVLARSTAAVTAARPRCSAAGILDCSPSRCLW